MARKDFKDPTNPYHYALHCISGKWKMTILHEISTFGRIHFNKTLKVLPITEKVLSQQLKELSDDGLVERVVDATTYPVSTYYTLTKMGKQVIPAVDLLYIWAIRNMHAQDIPIDEDCFQVHVSDKYIEYLNDIIDTSILLKNDAMINDTRSSLSSSLGFTKKGYLKDKEEG